MGEGVCHFSLRYFDGHANVKQKKKSKKFLWRERDEQNGVIKNLMPRRTRRYYLLLHQTIDINYVSTNVKRFVYTTCVVMTMVIHGYVNDRDNNEPY